VEDPSAPGELSTLKHSWIKNQKCNFSSRAAGAARAASKHAGRRPALVSPLFAGTLRAAARASGAKTPQQNCSVVTEMFVSEWHPGGGAGGGGALGADAVGRLHRALAVRVDAAQVPRARAHPPLRGRAHAAAAHARGVQGCRSPRSSESPLNL
jgi:hypothetical protein